jgi:hypothetical protein
MSEQSEPISAPDPQPPAPLDPHAPNAVDPLEFVDANGVIRNLWHVGPSLGREEITLGAIPPLIMGRPQAIALAVWLPIALDLTGQELLDMIESARSSLRK